MNKKAKAILYNFLGFAPIFLLLYFTIPQFTGLTGLFIPLTAFVVATILAPKFQAIKYQGQEKILMKWLFIKGVKEVK
ncbi:hypothetical protein E0W68_08565 [Flavobacterium salilacus subsp. salilacus]|uniref:hypothetical protein n=1 Tax=Flavobacterium TaxID=237 RepID=UPI001074DF8C|nr:MULTISPECIES: hypothetical protein [Flavobacterium]KAF2518790.1 hypothetical protein E0W68_08565 [Flavobacterium salilacus subsp. salilacus]MBE1613759.1 hypothetical protein [Flavobacterium sp. SaA2.13]